ncbi:LolA family protein [Neptunitalea chrysea]|nr:outer membrane lipoprotein carrier protein LolA [Neptunitalea chrysea]
MKKFALTALILWIGINSVAAQNSAKAKSLLDEVYNKVGSYKNLYIDFKFELVNKDAGVNQETKGNVTIEGDKYALNYIGVFKMFDGHKIYTIVPDNEEVTIENKGADDASTITPSKMLTFYKDGYTYKWKETKKIKGRDIQIIELTPISSKAEVSNILLGIDTQTKHIYNVVENGKNSTSTIITVNSMKTDQPLPKNTFVFNREKYKKLGYYISE